MEWYMRSRPPRFREPLRSPRGNRVCHGSDEVRWRRTCESAFFSKWYFGAMTMWLVVLMTIVKIHLRSLVPRIFVDMVDPPHFKKSKGVVFWRLEAFVSVLFESSENRTTKRGQGG